MKRIFTLLFFCCFIYCSPIFGQGGGLTPLHEDSTIVYNGPPKEANGEISTLPKEDVFTNGEIVKGLMVMVFGLLIFSMLLFRVKTTAA